MIALLKQDDLPITMLKYEEYFDIFDHGCLKTLAILVRCEPEAALAILQQMERELVMPSEISFNCALGFARYKLCVSQ